jgi:hypothetical protein
MSWAVALEGRSDRGSIVLLFDERSEAESIAQEIRTRGTRVEVQVYPRAGERSDAVDHSSGLRDSGTTLGRPGG